MKESLFYQDWNFIEKKIPKPSVLKTCTNDKKYIAHTEQYNISIFH